MTTATTTTNFFYNDMHPVRSPGDTQGRCLCGYMWKISINHSLEQVEVVVVGEATTWELIPRGSIQ